MTAPIRPTPIGAKPLTPATTNAPPPMELRAHTTPTTITEIGAASLLVVGPPGSGKTEFACGMPDPLFLQFDSNMTTLEKHPNIPYLVPFDWMQHAPGETSTTKVFSERVLPMFEARRAHEIVGRPVGTIVCDTGTEMGDDLAMRIIGVKTNQSDSQARFGEFLREGHQLFRRIADLAKPRGDLPRYNVAVLFHLTDVTDDKGNLLAKAPAIIGRLKNEIQRRFDVCLLMRCRAETAVSVAPGQAPGAKVTTFHYEGCTVPPERAYEGLAFDRIGGKGPWATLPPVVANPSYERLVELWKADA